MRDFWRGRGRRRRVRAPADRLVRPLPGRRPAPVRLGQLHHRPRRLHAARPRLLQREAQRGQPGGQPRRDRRQPVLELRRRGGDRRPRGQRAARAPAAQLPRHAAPLPGRADAARRRRDRAHAARQQQRLVPGQRDLVVRLGARRARASASSSSRKRLIALRRAHPVFHRRDFLTGEDRARLRPARRVVVPARRPADDPARLERGRAPARAVPQRRRDHGAGAGGRAGGGRLVPAAVQRRRARTRRSTCRAGASARSGGSCSTPPTPTPSPARARSRAQAPLDVTSRARWCCCGGSTDVAAFRATYRLQLGAGHDVRRRRRARALPARPRRLAPVPVARVRGARGLDARLRRGRPDAALGRARRRGRASARSRRPRARRGWGSCSTSCPNHMATDDANPYWADPERRAQVLRHRPGDRPPPALLRHRPPRRRAPGGPRGVRGDAPARARARARRARRRAARRPPRRARRSRPATCERLRDGGAEHVWVEKILDPGEQLRDWPVEGTVGYEFLNDVAALFVDPAGEAPLTALWEELSGDARPFGEWAAEAKLEQARDDVRARRRLAAAAVAGGRGAGGGARRAARLPHLHPRPAGARGPARAARGRARRSGSRRRRAEFVTRFQQTTPPMMAKGVEDTAFYRYVAAARALNDVGGDPSRFVDRRRRVPRRQRRARRALPARPAGHADARHQALGRRARADRRAGRHGGRVGGARAALARAVRAAADGRRAGRDRGVHDLPDARGRVADRARAAVRVHGEGDARGASATRAGSSRTPAGRRACSPTAARCTTTRRSAPRSSRSPRAWRVVGELHALRQTALKLTVPGVPDVYQGDELVALSLVDPDNRRPVDWARRRELLDELRGGARRTAATRASCG